jgi:hypothetical protein
MSGRDGCRGCRLFEFGVLGVDGTKTKIRGGDQFRSAPAFSHFFRIYHDIATPKFVVLVRTLPTYPNPFITCYGERLPGTLEIIRPGSSMADLTAIVNLRPFHDIICRYRISYLICVAFPIVRWPQRSSELESVVLPNCAAKYSSCFGPLVD